MAAAKASREVEAKVESERLEREAERISISDVRRLFRNGRFIPIEDIPDDMAGAIASVETVNRKGAEGPEQIRKIRFWDKNTAHKTLFQLRGDGKVNDQNVNVKGDVAIAAKRQEFELATRQMTQEELARAVQLDGELKELYDRALARARAKLGTATSRRELRIPAPP